MSYKYDVLKSIPYAAWMLDSVPPYADCTGFGNSGGKNPTTSNPSTAAAVVSGAGYSSVFSNIAQGKFYNNIFKAGSEEKSFALEAWVNPVQKTVDVQAQSYMENIHPNPRLLTATSTWGSTTGTGGTTTNTRETSGGWAGLSWFKVLWSTASTAGNPSLNACTARPIDPNTTISVSLMGITNFSREMKLWVDWNDSSSSYIGSSVVASTPTANTWTRYTGTFTAPSNAATFSVRLRTTGTTMAVGEYIGATACMISKTPTVQPYFDGSMPGFEYYGSGSTQISRTRSDVSLTNVAAFPNKLGYSNTNNTYPTSGSPEGRGYTRKTFNATTTLTRGNDLLYTANYWPFVPTGWYVYYAVWVRSSIAQTVCLQSQPLSSTSPVIGGGGSEHGSDVSLSPNVWKMLTYSTNNPLPDGVITVRLDIDTGRSSSPNQYNSGDTLDACMATIIMSPTRITDGSVAAFTGWSPGDTWAGTSEASESFMLVSQSDQQILSHSGYYDGLSINGNVIKFSTQYSTAPEAACTYDLGISRAAHVVGIHTEYMNELWVNGEQVDTIELTDDQWNDSYVSSDPYLYSGASSSSQQVAMNGVAFYNNITPTQIQANYAAGINVIGQEHIYPVFDGLPFNLVPDFDTVVADQTWATNTDFELGYRDSVDFFEDRIVPSYESDISVAGTWSTSLPLDSDGDTSIYGVLVEWSGNGAHVQGSLDNETWYDLVSGELFDQIPQGYDPTNETLYINVSFAGGLAEDDSYLDSLHVVEYRNANFPNTTGRELTATYPAVLRSDYEPILYRNDNGVYLGTGKLTIGADTDDDVMAGKTIELWVKPISQSPGFYVSMSGDRYRNGALDSTAPVGQWSLIHIAGTTDTSAVDINIKGDVIVGQIVLYPDTLSADQILSIYQSYTGRPHVRFTDSTVVNISEDAAPIDIYTHDWSIVAAG